MSDIFEQLASPFDPSEVDWRVGSTNSDKSEGMALAYIDARTVMDRLDMVCGPAGWQCRYVLNGTKTVCELGIKCGDEWVWKSDGAGDSDIEAEKGALSDAFKRSAVRWGIGRYLYNLKSPWVALKQKGKSYIIAPEAMRQLEDLLRGNRPTDPKKDDKPKLTPDQVTAKAKKFVNDSLFAISECESISDLDAWFGASAKAVAWIKVNKPDEYAYLSAAIDKRRGELARDAA